MKRDRLDVMTILLRNSIEAHKSRIIEIENTEPLDEAWLKTYKELLEEKYKQLDDIITEKSALFDIDTKPAMA